MSLNLEIQPKLDSNYNPDVLTCLANLSNDEVFTPPTLANDMLDQLPEELWSDPNATFLDPVSKSGVFLREIAKRLMVGLESQIPDTQERINHIYTKQLYGIGITELTALLTRRSLYCSKYANGKYSIVTAFSDENGNIDFTRVEHKWFNDHCVFCGASQSEYDRSEDLETHAYKFIHTNKPEELYKMQFDVIIGNPPYQLSDGGNGASAMPIYHKFIEQAKKLNPRYLTMIIPARWYVGGRGLDEFRNTMLNDDRIRVVHDYPSSADCFPGVEIKGGVMYFLWDRDHRGDARIYSHIKNQVTEDTRPLLEEGMETFIRDSVAITVLDKTKITKDKFSSILKAGRHFGFHTKVDWDGDKGTLQTADGKSNYPISRNETDENQIKVYIAHGHGYISDENVTKNLQDVDKWKVIIPRSGNPGGSIIGKPKISEPKSCSSNTYIVVLPENNSEEAANNVRSYLKTRFVRYLVSLRTTTQDMAPKSYDFVPLQDFSEEWSDEKLYEKYGLTEEEISAIESTVPSMELGN